MTAADSPYCEINKSHAGHGLIDTTFESVDKKKWSNNKLVKSRNEPCRIVQVAEVVAKARGEPIDDVIKAAYQNSVDLFGGKERLKKFGGTRD